jgi:uncharacterized protein YecE (DUF72 family)
MGFRIGCCGFPVSMRKYMEKFDVVEVQKTFYKLPSPETAERWRRIANRDFEFVVKANQVITHPPTSPTYRKAGIKAEKGGFFQPSEDVSRAWEETLQIATILRSDKVLFQTPSSFKFSEENVKNMLDFFSTVEKIKPIWEPRGWSRDELFRVRERMDEMGIIHCVDPFVSKPLFGNIRYFRLHGRYEGGRIIYSHRYLELELEMLADIVKSDLELAKPEETYVLFNNKYMLDNALKFKELLHTL